MIFQASTGFGRDDYPDHWRKQPIFSEEMATIWLVVYLPL